MKDRYSDPTPASSRRGTRRRRRSGSQTPRLETRGIELDRLVKENATALTFTGLTLGVFLSRRFFIVPIAVAAALFQDVLRDAWGGGRRR